MKALDPVQLRNCLGGPVLIVGGRGMLARAFAGELSRLGVEHAAVGRPELDITDSDATLRHIADGRWTVVLNCAAWTNVDGAETDEAGATRVNGTGVANLRDACFERQALLVNFGTDYVFSGTGTRPYLIDEPLAPLNAYGRSKAAGERELASMLEVLHIRTSWLYAPWGNNFVRTMARLLREKPSLKVVNDQRGRPTSAEHLARVTLALITAGARGTFHAADGGECTWFEFTIQIGRLTGSTAEVEPCTSAEFPRPAKRPAYSVLDLSQTESLIGPMPDWRANLADVVTRLEP